LRKNEDQLTKLKKEVVNLKNAISRQRVTIFQLTQEQNDETQQQRINSLGKEVFQALRDNQKLAEINKQLNEQLLCKLEPLKTPIEKNKEGEDVYVSYLKEDIAAKT